MRSKLASIKTSRKQWNQLKKHSVSTDCVDAMCAHAILFEDRREIKSKKLKINELSRRRDLLNDLNECVLSWPYTHLSVFFVSYRVYFIFHFLFSRFFFDIFFIFHSYIKCTLDTYFLSFCIIYTHLVLCVYRAILCSRFVSRFTFNSPRLCVTQ